jgi:hypothetical protein
MMIEFVKEWRRFKVGARADLGGMNDTLIKRKFAVAVSPAARAPTVESAQQLPEQIETATAPAASPAASPVARRRQRQI